MTASTLPVLTVAYVVTIVPDAIHPFTADELDALEHLVSLQRVGLIGRRYLPGWRVGRPAHDPRLWISVLVQLTRRPWRLATAIGILVRTGWRRPLQLLPALRAAAAACDLARLPAPSVLHADFAGPAAAAVFVWSRLSGVPYSVRTHAYDIYRPYAWAGAVLQHAAEVVPISEHGRRTIAARWSIESTVVHVGVPTARIPRRTPGPPANPFRLVSAAHLVPKKGLDVAVAAAHRVAAAGHPISLDIFGGGYLRSRLEQLARGPARVRLRGTLASSELRARLREYDAFVLAARVASDGDMDGIPVVLMEAMAAKLPVVTTSVAGIPELVRDKTTGTLVPPTVEGVASGIIELIDEYATGLDLAEAGYAHVASDFDLRVTAAEMVRVWEQIAINRP